MAGKYGWVDHRMRRPPDAPAAGWVGHRMGRPAEWVGHRMGRPPSGTITAGFTQPAK